MEIKRIPLDEINPAKYNPRKDLKPGDPEYEKLKKSIDEFDLVEPLVMNKRSNVLISGHQRLKILKERGDMETEVSIVDLSPERERALNIALNKIRGDWDLPKPVSYTHLDVYKRQGSGHLVQDYADPFYGDDPCQGAR